MRMSLLKKQARAWWNRNPCMSHHSNLKGKKYFLQIKRIRYKLHPWIKEIIKNQFPSNGSKLLEIGCGQGIDLLEFLKMGFSVIGMDFSLKSIKLSKKYFKLFNEKACFLVGDAENLEFRNNTFDLVYSYGVLHHTPNTQKAINEIHRVLKSDGKAIVMLYNKYSILRFLHPDIRSYEGRRKEEKEKCPIVKAYSVKEVKKMFSKFSELKIKKENVGRFRNYLPKFLKDRLGWHIIIQVKK